ncbi:TIGR02569 family protein [Catellatospora sp. NPDC049609]|uniref:TIGR02569 family protein n=1 Tax=Catellatospora sp. NPDC049609 TaxID=3155505 RepID=UPI003445AE0F
MTALAPPAAVISAFGIDTAPVPQPGGQGVTWRAGDVILKPVVDAVEAAWCAEVLDRLETDGSFRVARPVAAADGWIVRNWSAWRFVAGTAADHRVAEIAAVGAAFHAAVAHLPRPDLLDRCDDPWRYGDRLAWEEEQLPSEGPYVAELRQLAALRTPVTDACQLVHPDLAGNVLFAEPLGPAVIDWPPYWRPPAWATAIVAVDGMDTGRVAPSRALSLGQGRAWHQHLVRAEMFRLGTKNRAALRGLTLVDDKIHHRLTVDRLVKLVGNGCGQ